MPELEKMFELLSEDELRAVIAESCKDDAVRDIVTEFVRRKLEFTPDDVRTETSILISNADDYIYLEKSMFDTAIEELFPENKALALLAETIYDGFYDRAEMMVGMGMLSEARLFIRSVAEAVRYYAGESSTLLLSLCGDSAERYADDLESFLNSDDPLGGFHKR